jgi:hypothetical protein
LWISDAGGRRDLLRGPPDDLQFALAIHLGRIWLVRRSGQDSTAFECRVLAATRNPVADPMPAEAMFPLSELDRMLPLSDTAAGSERGRRSSRPSVSSRGTRTILKEPETRRLKNRGHLARTGSSNPSPSSRQSVSLPQSFSKVEKPGFPRGCARLAWRPGRQRRAGCFDIAPTGNNISVGPYSSTAVRLMWWRDCHAGPNEVGPSLTYGRSLNPDWAQAKPSTIR